jgi:hypothetical protein
MAVIGGKRGLYLFRLATSLLETLLFRLFNSYSTQLKQSIRRGIASPG